MNREYVKRYSTKEFAELFSISKHTLFYYDKIGLFSPAGRDSNGYRYYTSDQINDLDTILTLRNVGLPIESIMAYIKAENPDSLLSIFQIEKNQIDKRISELQHIRTSISKQTELLEDFRGRKEGEIDIRYFNEERIKESVNKDDIDDEEEWSLTFSALIDDSSKSDLLNQGSTVSLADAINGQSSKVNSIFIKRNDGNRTIPDGLYGVIYTKRPYDDFDSLYSKLLDKIDAEGYEAISDSYEEYALTDIPGSTATRIRIKVKEKGSENNP